MWNFYKKPIRLTIIVIISVIIGYVIETNINIGGGGAVGIAAAIYELFYVDDDK